MQPSPQTFQQPPSLTPEMPLDHNQILRKASSVSAALDIGRTLLRELHTQGHANFDPSFPKPLSLTANGPTYFAVDELVEWVQRLKRLRDAPSTTAANDPVFRTP